MENQLDKRKRIAPESIKTKKAREKLLKQWKEQDELITPAALADTVDKIHKWIAANATHRVHVKEKALHLFDQNKNAAALSRKVEEIAQKLREALPVFEKAFDQDVHLD